MILPEPKPFSITDSHKSRRIYIISHIIIYTFTRKATKSYHNVVAFASELTKYLQNFELSLKHAVRTLHNAPASS